MSDSLKGMHLACERSVRASSTDLQQLAALPEKGIAAILESLTVWIYALTTALH